MLTWSARSTITVSCLADIMLNLTKDSFNEIVPDVDYGEEEAE